ncbi:MAG: UDP-3-O-(3-hydroxymyristoyl)glucosamine N-acyltransferase [Pseudobdellovibrionaceae bacterium]|jgi:UDP-3-O-[3-hydroxymyristoyl] glucosamine N-acyltransferase|nr:UDP-3-O-(3-hydroxymyristoyl)glucosamine N-acyltransferase [Pseudobdellovibrionaceae bacterium]
MADARFFPKPSPLSLAQVAGRIGAELHCAQHGDYVVSDVAALDVASDGHLSFLDNKKYKDQFAFTNAGACIIHPDMLSLAPPNVRLLLSKTPYKSYALAAQAFYPEQRPEPSISKLASIHPSAKIGEAVHISDFVSIGEGAVIGNHVWIESHASIGRGVELADGVRIGNHATISHAIIGLGSRIYPGVRIGQDGFGFAIDPSGFVKVPQLGRVVIGDMVEVGANTTIDRGASGDTVIGSGSWIDNLVQIAHNVKIGRGCIIVAQAGIAGSTELGDFVVLAGQSGVAGHLKIGSMAKVAAKSGVTKDIPPKEEWMGYPAMPMKKYLRQSVYLSKVTERKKEGTNS